MWHGTLFRIGLPPFRTSVGFGYSRQHTLSFTRVRTSSLRFIQPRPLTFTKTLPSSSIASQSASADEIERGSELYTLLSLPSEDFLAKCKQEFFRTSGPGGQHRNRVNTASRVVYKGVRAECSEHRSGPENLRGAVRELQVRLAVLCRADSPPTSVLSFPGSKGRISPSNPHYALFIAQLLDALEGSRGQVKECAAFFPELTATAILRVIFADKRVTQSAQAIRTRHNLALLRNPRK